jgi:hypothetical protein
MGPEQLKWRLGSLARSKFTVFSWWLNTIGSIASIAAGVGHRLADGPLYGVVEVL